jgi:hypothetical protein
MFSHVPLHLATRLLLFGIGIKPFGGVLGATSWCPNSSDVLGPQKRRCITIPNAHYWVHKYQPFHQILRATLYWDMSVAHQTSDGIYTAF